MLDDNDLVREVAGPHDRNLALLEALTSARIDPRGNEIAVSGPAGARARARAAIEALLQRARNRLPIEDVDVRAAALGNAAAAPGPAAAAGDAVAPVGAGARLIKTPKRVIGPRNSAQGAYLDALARADLAFGVGPAGTGKTYLAVAHAVELLLSGAVERVVLSRPAIEAGERIGFLPGDMKDKVDPYLQPLYDALHDMLHVDYVARRIAAGDIEIAPLAFMRGRTLARAAVILDEAQNATIAQMKMFLTRLGEGARMAITGDPTQSDLPTHEASGLADALVRLQGVEGVSVSRFTSADVVRHPLVARILERYERDASARGAPRP
ncbi:MAG: AAA family ATPase [Alphaproteobacteria bacterium]|nr:AAA family ATPase [Alphaproteobacteria bacterium]